MEKIKGHMSEKYMVKDDGLAKAEAVHFDLLPKKTKGDDDHVVIVPDNFQSESDSESQDEEDVMSLLHYCRYERLNIKDFHCEIRGGRDVDLALCSSVVLLGLNAYNLSQIVQSMLNSLRASQPDCDIDMMAAKQSIFTPGSESVLSKTIQGTVSSVQMGGTDFDQGWLCILCELPSTTQRHVVFARMVNPVNLGPTCQETRLVILVIAPSKEKVTKSIVETGRTFASLFTDLSFRHRLLTVSTKDGFRKLLRDRTLQMAKSQGHPEFRRKFSHQLTLTVFDEEFGRGRSLCPPGKSIWADLRRRLPHYWSDYTDGFVGHRTSQKLLSAILFLYFACVLPNLAFGMLNSTNTNGAIGVKKILFSQMLGGIVFGVVGGQPLIVLLTTAPLTLFTKIIFDICEEYDLDFRAMYACVGLWNAGFLIVYAMFGASRLMKWSTRSTEEIFSLFVGFVFCVDAIRDTVKDFLRNYHTQACQGQHSGTDDSLSTNASSGDVFIAVEEDATTASSLNIFTSVAAKLQNIGYNVSSSNSSISSNMTISNSSILTSSLEKPQECLRESSILFLLLMLGTVWIGLTLFNFTRTPFLTARKREFLADYALPIAVLLVSVFGSFVFKDVKMKPYQYDSAEPLFEVPSLTTLPPAAVAASAGLGFCLSLLFFMHQSISSAVVNTPNNKLKKGAAYHWDLLVVALINGFLSVFSLPWIHASSPQSPLHMRALADIEERVEQGSVQQVIVNVRETRVSGIASHVLIGLSMFLLPYPLTYISRPVLDGLFLYTAITALSGNQLFDRVLLLFTEQTAYPPSHYIRRVPQSQVHGFTTLQLTQLLILCIFGFSPTPYMKMVFPMLLMLLIPIRHGLVPSAIKAKYLKVLDRH